MSTAQDNIVGNKKVVSFPTSSAPAPNTGPTPYVMPRQTGTGSQRGVQNITGELNVIDPDTNRTNINVSGKNGYVLFTNPNVDVSQIIVGKLPDNSYGLNVSKIDPATGKPYDVLKATPDQLAFSSAFDSLKVVKTDVVTLTSTGSPTGASPVSAIVNHNLGFVPSLIAYVEFSGSRIPLPYTLYDVTTGAIRNRIYAQIDSSKVLFLYQDWETTGSTYTYSIRYYLLQETAA